MAAAADLKFFFWKALNRLERTPIRPLVRATTKGSSATRIWSRFRPTATRLEDVSVTFSDYEDTRSFVAAAANLLQGHGVVVMNGLVPPLRADQAREEIDHLVARIRLECHLEERSGEVDGILWQRDGAVLESYRKLADHPDPVITLRGSASGEPDFGMIDVFGAEKLAQNQGYSAVSELLLGRSAEFTATVVHAIFAFKRRVYNIYRNDSVTRTRTLHIDNLVHSYKSFVYLGDVTDLRDGPYTYVPGSQLRRGELAKTMLLNKLDGHPRTDFPMLKGKELCLTGSKGTVIITCQAGIHGGHPQEEGGARTVLVTHYTA